MELKVKTVSGKILLIVEFEKSSNFWIEDAKRATWSPRWKELKDILHALKVVDVGNKELHDDNEQRSFYS